MARQIYENSYKMTNCVETTLRMSISAKTSLWRLLKSKILRRPGKQRLHCFKVLVRATGTAMQQKNFHVSRSDLLGPDVVFSSDNRDHLNACNLDTFRVQIIDTGEWGMDRAGLRYASGRGRKRGCANRDG